MTRETLKAAIRRGDPTPGVEQALFESAYMEVLRESHPDSRLVVLSEARDGTTRSDGLPVGVHERVAAMLDASRTRRDQVRQLHEAKSDLKDDTFLDPPARDAATLGKLPRDAGDRFKQSQHPDAIQARIQSLDGQAKPWRFTQAPTLSEAMVEADRLPKNIHAIVAGRLR